jgi:hypothetical protein
VPADEIVGLLESLANRGSRAAALVAMRQEVSRVAAATVPSRIDE